MVSTCSANALYGIEITKPRRNMADTNVPQSEVDNYLNAITNIASMPAYQFPDGDQCSTAELGAFFCGLSTSGECLVQRAWFGWFPATASRISQPLRNTPAPGQSDGHAFLLGLDDGPKKPAAVSPIRGAGRLQRRDRFLYSVLTPPPPPASLDPFLPNVSRLTGSGSGVHASHENSHRRTTIIGESTVSLFAAWDEGRGGGTGWAHNYSHVFIGGAVLTAPAT